MAASMFSNVSSALRRNKSQKHDRSESFSQRKPPAPILIDSYASGSPDGIARNVRPRLARSLVASH